MSLPIGFFTPLPLPIMIPFMFAQSAAMALAFGSNFQYGKRKISSMSNEDFNLMSALEMNNGLASTMNAMIPTIEESFKHFEEMNTKILNSMARYFAQAIEFGFDVLTGKQSISGTDSHFDIAHAGLNIIGQEHIHPPDNQVSGLPSPAAVAAGGTSDLSPYEQWAAKWINYSKNTANFTSATFGELRFMLDTIAKGKGQKTTKWRATILQEWEKKTPQFDTPEQGITKSGLTGLNETIARNISTMKRLLAAFKLDTLKRPADTGQLTKFLNFAKEHNRLMQSNRKYSFVVDTSKTINARPPKLIFKT